MIVGFRYLRLYCYVVDFICVDSLRKFVCLEVFCGIVFDFGEIGCWFNGCEDDIWELFVGDYIYVIFVIDDFIDGGIEFYVVKVWECCWYVD